MTAVLSFPFRIDAASGHAATVTVGSDDEAAEAIAMLALVRVDERELCPGFGTNDPAYTADVDVVAEIRTGLTLWGPPGVTVTEDSLTIDTETGIGDLVITFNREET